MNEDEIRLVILRQAKVAESHCIPLFVSNGNASFGNEHHPFEIPQGCTFKQICKSIRDLSEEGLLEYSEAGSTQGDPNGIVIKRLTRQGRDFLDAM
jgi:hypothetical protein